MVAIRSGKLEKRKSKQKGASENSLPFSVYSCVTRGRERATSEALCSVGNELLARAEFAFGLSNPPCGKPWKRSEGVGPEGA